MKPEFGNLEQIAMLNAEKELRATIEEQLKMGVVGMQEIEGCGACGAPVRDCSETRTLDGKRYLMCMECNSIIKIF